MSSPKKKISHARTLPRHNDSAPNHPSEEQGEMHLGCSWGCMRCTGGGVFGVYSGGYSGVFRGVFGGYSGGIRGYSGPTAPLRDTVFTGCGLVRGGVFGASGPTLYNTRGGGGGGPGGGNPGPTRNSRILTAQKFPNANASRTSTAPKCPNANATTNRPGL